MTGGPAGPLDIRETPSPNFGDRRPGADGAPAPIDMLVLHYTDMASAEESLARLCDPETQVSAHYLIGEDGTVHRLAAEEKRAWHAGLAFWGGVADVNSRSIGIELQNPGHRLGYRPFPPVQIAALTALARDILSRHPIPQRNVLGHSDVAPDRKTDPGELFPWRALAAEGIGLWPETIGEAPQDVGAALAEIGYDPDAERAVAAFQRRFRPDRIDNDADDQTARLIEAYRRLVREST